MTSCGGSPEVGSGVDLLGSSRRFSGDSVPISPQTHGCSTGRCRQGPAVPPPSTTNLAGWGRSRETAVDARETRGHRREPYPKWAALQVLPGSSRIEP